MSYWQLLLLFAAGSIFGPMVADEIRGRWRQRYRKDRP